MKEERGVSATETTELTGEQFAALVEERVQAAFDMSLDEFEAALTDGRLDPDAPHVASLAILVGA